MSRSVSPSLRRFSSSSGTNGSGSGTSNKGQEDLINAYEAEEERIINVLSRKLEQLREEKISLENALEAESESHVNRLSRQLTALKMGQVNGNGYPTDPSTETMLETLRRENEQLRGRLVDTERDYIRISRLNEIYLEELIEHRKRLGIPIDNIVGLSGASVDPFSQPTHHRSSSSSSSSYSSVSPSTSILHIPQPTRGGVPIPHTHGVPIPRPPSQIHRPSNNTSSAGTTPLSHSPSSSESPYPLSSFVSANTNLTSPPSSSSFNPVFGLGATPQRGLSYPSVPPPSLSSSFGSPTVSYHIHNARDGEDSRPTRGRNQRSLSRRRESVERGARIAETGTLRPRAGSTTATTNNLPSTREGDGEATGLDTMELGGE